MEEAAAGLNNGQLPEMKYCECEKPKCWDGDLYCQRCNGLTQEIVGCPTLIGEVMGQFAFMIAMADTTDNNFGKLHDINLNILYRTIEDKLTQHADENGMIVAPKHEIHVMILECLSEYSTITDIIAIIQNVLYRLKILDKEL